MRRYHEILTNSGRSKVCGNHSVEIWSNPKSMTFINDKTNEKMYIEGTRAFRYHGNTICIVDDEKKAFVLSHCGWFTPSTSTALGGYREYFEYELGYTNLNKIPVYKHERNKKEA